MKDYEVDVKDCEIAMKDLNVDVKDYEVAVELGFEFEYYTVRAASEPEAKQSVWIELDVHRRDNVSSMEVVSVTNIVD